MTHETELKIEAAVAAFVAGLAGRFREHCSDAMLVAVLMHQMRGESWRVGKCRGTVMLEGDFNAAYEVACPIFERVLEHGCRAGYNGHHVAQDFAAAMERAFPVTMRKEGAS